MILSFHKFGPLNDQILTNSKNKIMINLKNNCEWTWCIFCKLVSYLSQGNILSMLQFNNVLFTINDF